ncbi:MAG TPA: cytochrome c oxidase subunit 3, partial [Saprospiraceae bacterium]|nr:cytochrome c oxidase subunit 3 [Saprospiraceae bacterium]
GHVNLLPLDTNIETGTIRTKTRGIYPPLFALWVAMGGMVMMFGSLTSAYIVRHAAGNWLEFRIPNIFFVSTAVILLSSVTLHASYKAFQKGLGLQYRSFLLATLLLGIAFIILQYEGWLQLYKIGVALDGNPGGSFFYVISGIHAAHVTGGIFALTTAALHAFSLPYRPTEKRRRRFQLVVHYWHFVDFLWLYLFLFLMIQ